MIVMTRYQRSPFYPAVFIFGLGVFLLLPSVPQAVAAGGVYEWTDDKGVVHFTDDPGKIPKKFHNSVRELRPPDKEEEKAPKGITEEEGIESESRPASPPKVESEPERSRALPSEPVDFHGHNQEWWRQRVQEWQQKKTDAQARLADAQDRLGQERFLNATTGNMKRIQDISAEVSKYEEEVREAERMLTDGLPDEARRAQAPPGWLRD